MKKDKEWEDAKKGMLALVYGIVGSLAAVGPATLEHIDDIKKENRRKRK